MAKKKALKLFTTEDRAWAATTSFCVIPYKDSLFWCAEQLARFKMCKAPAFRQDVLNTFTVKSLFFITREQQLLAKGFKIDPNYDREKEMLIATRKKFRYNPVLAEYLLRTENAELIYDNPYDDFFGVGRDGNGENRYGPILEKVRRELATGRIEVHPFDSSLLDKDDEPPTKKTTVKKEAVVKKKSKDDKLVSKVLNRKPKG